MDFLEFSEKNIICFDGGTGTLLQERGLMPGEHPETWNITHPDVITDIHKAYFDAGSNVVCTNTFGANSLKFSDEELENIIKNAINNAKNAINLSKTPHEKFVALDIGPSGKLLKPLGDLDFEDAVSVFAKTVKLGVKYGADLILIETMNDSYETKAALLAAKENSTLPVIVSNAYGEDGKLMTGATPEAMTAMIEGMGAFAVGANCSLGPKQLSPVVERILAVSSIPVIMKPNAGLPKSENGKTVFDVGEEEFAQEMEILLKKGVRIAGGCCGTTPAYIKALKDKISKVSPVPETKKDITVVSSYTKAVPFGKEPLLIGERINPTGKKRFKQALVENDVSYILSEGIGQQEKGAHILDVNVGLPEIDEQKMLVCAVTELQAVVDIPLQIDTSDACAMEKALRRYNGKAMINSVNGKEESMHAVFPLVKKYGGVVVALTLDENGIPETARGRVNIAKKILETAKEYGIEKKDIVFDALALTISADARAAKTTLEAVKLIKEELHSHTVLGVSNVSFGLPNRSAVNSLFFALALGNGLSSAIINPYSAEMIKTYYSFRALAGLDENCADYINASKEFSETTFGSTDAGAKSGDAKEQESALKNAIIKGLKDKAAQYTKVLLEKESALDVINNEIIPALNIVGEGFENKTVYLPQLLISAECAKSAFEVIKNAASREKSADNGIFVLATVKGDIHDIGKNIVKLLLQNYGYNVIDLGKDVPPEAIVEKTVELHAPLVGLSALMTTTVPAMEETIKQLRKSAPWCKIIVGGAVLTKDYADKIGADKYAKDAMETVRFAQQITNGK
ncbi:MAG: homocysteine S-methyltransferase family protein [Clostridiales bacterium]|nr:homocysteine S-methyltransferase family protein [Clostridiales bacterium]